MVQRPPIFTRAEPLFPYTPPVRSETSPPSPPLGDCIERRQQRAIDARRQHRCVLCGGCRLRRNRHSPKANVIHKTPQHLSCHQTSTTKICLHVCHVAQQSILQVRNRGKKDCARKRGAETAGALRSLGEISASKRYGDLQLGSAGWGTRGCQKEWTWREAESNN